MRVPQMWGFDEILHSIQGGLRYDSRAVCRGSGAGCAGCAEEGLRRRVGGGREVGWGGIGRSHRGIIRSRCVAACGVVRERAVA